MDWAGAAENAARLPWVSRAAVLKHPAGVARGAARARERGREWHYSLDARPLGTVYREWLESFAPSWEDSLGRLKRHVEGGVEDYPPPRR